MKKCSNSEDDDLQREALAVLTVIKPDEIQEVSLSFFHSSSLQKNKLVKVMTEIDSQQLLKQLTEMDFSYALKQLKHYASRGKVFFLFPEKFEFLFLKKKKKWKM